MLLIEKMEVEYDADCTGGLAAWEEKNYVVFRWVHVPIISYITCLLLNVYTLDRKSVV